MKRHRLTVIMAIILVLLFILNLTGGAKWYSPMMMVEHNSSLTSQIFWTIRIPRGLNVSLVGALLAVSGQLMQSLSKNPIADPSILGINAGANLALMTGAIAGLSLNIFNTMWLSILGAGVAFIVVMGLSMTQQGIDPLRFILGGTIFSGFVSCLAYAVGLLTNSTMQFRNLLIGGFSGTNFAQVKLLSAGFLLIAAVIFMCRKSLTLLVLDDATAKALGARPSSARLIAAVLVILAAGLSVGVGGNIGFIGLGIPQIVNYLHPDSFEHNAVPTILAGSCFMLLTDFIAKTVAAPTELPLSAFSAIVGGGFLFIILWQKQVKNG